MKLICVAMESEIKAYLNDSFKKIQVFPNKLYQKGDVLVLITNIGKVNAAFALTKVLSTYSDISLIINVGFAGATKPLNVGEIVAVTSATYHDFDLTIFGYEHGQVPNLPVYYKSDENILNQFMTNVKKGNLFTGDYFMSGRNPEPGFLVDMEGAALYQVAYLLNVPIVSFKVVSDVIDSNTQLDSYKAFEESIGSISIKVLLEDLFRSI